MQFQNNLLGESITKHSIYGKERYKKYCKYIAAIRRKRGRKIFPLGKISKEIVKLQRQQGITNTIKARHNADANGSYIIEREQLSQKEIESLKLTDLTPGNSQGERIYDSNGLSCSLSSQGGGRGANTGLYCVGTIPMVAKKRVHKTPKEINDYLRQYKLPFTLQEISEKLNIPKTQVEHYFRNDSSRSIPSPELWFKLKKILKFGNKYDKQVSEIYEKEVEFEQSRRVYDSQGIAPTLNTVNEPYMLTEARTEDAKLIRKENKKNGKDWSPRRGKELVPRTDGFGNCVTATQTKENLVVVPTNLLKTQRIRRITPTECERLQGYPDNWTKYGLINGKKTLMSDTQRYKMCGNSVTTNVITAIARKLLNGDLNE